MNNLIINNIKNKFKNEKSTINFKNNKFPIEITSFLNKEIKKNDNKKENNKNNSLFK